MDLLNESKFCCFLNIPGTLMLEGIDLLLPFPRSFSSRYLHGLSLQFIYSNNTLISRTLSVFLLNNVT